MTKLSSEKVSPEYSLMLGAGAGLVTLPKLDEASKGRGRHSSLPSLKSVKAGHEVEDIGAALIAKVLGSIAVIFGSLIGGVFFMVGHLNHAYMKRYAPLTAEQTTTTTPPLPRLQVHPLQDFGAYWRFERHRLNYYGWYGPHHVHARIPIARAMKLEVGRSLDQAP